MALLAEELSFLGDMDRFAALKNQCALAASGGTDLYTRTDASGVELYECWAGGFLAHNADDLDFAVMPFGYWPNVRAWLAGAQSHFTSVLAYVSIDDWLTQRRLRIDQRAAEVLSEAGLPISITNVHGAADDGAAVPRLPIGDLLYQNTYTAGTALDLTKCDYSRILGRVTVKGATDWALTVTAQLFDHTTLVPSTKTLTQTVLGTGQGGVVGDVYVLGRQAVGGGGAAAGQKVVPVAATGQFKAGQKVLLTQWITAPPNEVWVEQEIATIATISTDTSLTMVDNLLHTYTSAGCVDPTWKGISGVTSTGGNASDRIYFMAAADRRLKV
jgi:hypothetical protein